MDGRAREGEGSESMGGGNWRGREGKGEEYGGDDRKIRGGGDVEEILRE